MKVTLGLAPTRGIYHQICLVRAYHMPGICVGVIPLTCVSLLMQESVADSVQVSAGLPRIHGEISMGHCCTARLDAAESVIIPLSGFHCSSIR